MKNRNSKKLGLNKETMRTLQEDALKNVGGAAWTVMPSAPIRSPS
jgi:hypothetical protein